MRDGPKGRGMSAAIADDPTESPPRPGDTNTARRKAPTGWVRQHPWMVAGISGAIIVAILAAFLLLPGLTRKTPQVRLYTVQTQALPIAIGGGGLTYPMQSLNIIYPVQAQVVSVSTQVGEQVKKGQPLLVLDSAEIDRELAQARASWQAAQTYLNTLIADGVLSTTPQFAAAQAQVENARASYDNLYTLVNSSEYRNGKILAPFDGVVTALNVTGGSIAAANLTLVTIADLSTIYVHAQFPLDERAHVTLGATAEVDPVAMPGQKFTGKITEINPVLTTAGGGTFEVWISVANPNLEIFANESVFARVQVTQTMPVVPEVAVINPDADSIVFVYSAGHAHLRHVVVGARSGDQFGVLSGLTPGESVIILGQYQLHDGEAVAVAGAQP